MLIILLFFCDEWNMANEEKPNGSNHYRESWWVYQPKAAEHQVGSDSGVNPLVCKSITTR
jgi:hypothetical protein